MALHEIRFPSANGRDQIHGWIYAPATTPRAIVQIAHGLGEHSRRYLHLISALLALRMARRRTSSLIMRTS